MYKEKGLTGDPAGGPGGDGVGSSWLSVTGSPVSSSVKEKRRAYGAINSNDKLM